MQETTSSQNGECRKKMGTLEDAYLQIIKHHVKIKKQDKKVNNDILFTVLRELIRLMKESNDLFDSMKPRLEFLGSYYDGLRVGEPTEYDINLILRLPINYKKIVLDAKNVNPGYTKILMPSEFRRLSITPATAVKGFTETLTWCDKSYCLSVKAFKSWMQRVIDAAMSKLPENQEDNRYRILNIKHNSYRISTKMSGPANTLIILCQDNKNIDVDLVPTFSFQLPKKPVFSNVDFNKVESTGVKEYFVVPKPTEDSSNWRLAFPFQERTYLKNKNNLKNVVKLLKLLRDTQRFSKLASYFIKTVFLWEINEKNDDKFWRKKSLSYLTIYMLKKLQNSLRECKISNFWSPDHNLLDKVRPQTCENWSNRLKYIIKDIEQKKNIQVLKQYFVKNT